MSTYLHRANHVCTMTCPITSTNTAGKFAVLMVICQLETKKLKLNIYQFLTSMLLSKLRCLHAHARPVTYTLCASSLSMEYVQWANEALKHTRENVTIRRQ